MTEAALQQYIQAIRPADRAAMDAARKRQAELAKPPGSLGALEDISIRLAGITGQVCPKMGKCRVAVFAADVPGVGILDRKVRRGTGNIAVEDAMTRPEALAAMAAGMEQAARARADSITALGVGEMGIGNTSTSAAVLSALTGADIEAVTGRGGGLTDVGFARKKDVLRRALTRRAVDKDDVLDVLCAVGGLDVAAMTGAFLGCARERIPAAVDGFISVVAALCAVTLCPEVRDYLFLSHDSYEVGYRLAADRLDLEPCLHLGMRLGEGSGCPLLFRVLEGACGVMAGMATFAQAAIQDDYLDEIRAGDSFTVDKP